MSPRTARHQPEAWAVWRVARGLLAVAALIAVLAGVPWALLQYTEWPITGVPTWDQVSNFLDIAAQDTTIAALFVVGMWLAWAMFAACVVIEVVGEMRGAQVVRLPGVGPLQGMARTLVASAAMTLGSLSSLTSSGAGVSGPIPRAATAAAVISPPAAPHAAEADALQTADAGPGHADESAIEWQTLAVEHGDTAWELAERHYGDGTDWLQLWEDNRHQLQPDGRTWANQSDPIEPGWHLRVRVSPAQATSLTGADANGATSNTNMMPARRPLTAPGEVTTQPGDSFWSLAADCLGDALGRPATDNEIVPYWRRVVDANRSRLVDPSDPDLIYAGQTFLLPALDPGSGPGTSPSSPPPPPAEPTPAPPAEESPQVPTSTPTPTTGRSTPAPSSTVPDAAPAAPSQSSSTSTTPGGPGDSDPSAAPEDGGWSSDYIRVAIPVGLSAALATVALRALARRRVDRRRSIRPGSTAAPRPADDIDTELALASAGGEALTCAWLASHAFGTALLAMASPPDVTGVVVRPDGEVTLHLSEPAAPVEPFVGAPHEPSAWLLPGGDTDPEIDDGGVPPLETLVALGRTDDGSWVFVDLESLGAVSIEGNRQHAKALMQSLVAELALQPLNHYINLTVAGDIDAPETVEQGFVVVDHLTDEVVRILEQVAHDTATLLANEGAATSAAARVQGVSRDGLFVEVLAVGAGTDPVLLSRAIRAASPPGRCVTVLALEPLDAPATQLIANDDGTLQVPHLGLTVRPNRLEPDELRRINDVLRHETEMITTQPTEPRAEPEISPLPPADIGPYEEPTWAYRVRLFADLQVESHDGAAVSFRPRENPTVATRNAHRGPELLAYLALQPNRAATLHEIGENLWWGKRIADRTISNLISATRSALGGRSHLSHADRQTDHRYQLAPTVVTDHHLLALALDYARSVAGATPDLALAALRPHLATIKAKPFRERHLGSGLMDWASAYRVLDRIDETVVEAGLLAATLHTSTNGDGTDDALWAIDQALNACPTNELLVRTAMEIEMQTGARDAAERRYQALATHLLKHDLEPEEETEELHRRLIRSHHQIG